MSKEPSWQQIAHMLAERLANNDQCDQHDDIDDGVSQGCPFCKDRKVMRAYRRKAGLDGPMRPEGKAIPLHEVAYTDDSGQ